MKFKESNKHELLKFTESETIFAIYGKDATSKRVSKMILKIRIGKISNSNNNRLNVLIHEDPCQITRESTYEMGCDHAIVLRHLMPKNSNIRLWVQHVLNEL